MSKRHVDTAEAAKIHFPGIKFSVRTVGFQSTREERREVEFEPEYRPSVKGANDVLVEYAGALCVVGFLVLVLFMVSGALS